MIIQRRFGLGLLLAGLPQIRSQNHFAVTGVEVDPSGGDIPLRQNINDLQAQGGASWELYIQAISIMQKVDASDPLSLFQIAGIHGKPYIEWNGGGSKKATGWEGYCPHGEKLFLPWHRPLLLLYEQVLVETAKNVAGRYPQKFREQYLAAALALRAPYWDWASESYVPPSTASQTMHIRIPDGENLKDVEVDNPLWTFHFPAAAINGTFGSFDPEGRNQTYRCPAPQTYPGTANSNMANRPYKEWTYDAFTRATGFSSFASTGEGGTSLEQIHNGIHWDGGCAGQFLDATFSGFDPLFNVDRLWAYWQAINPDDSIFQDAYPGGSRYSTPEGTTITADSPLEPFYQPNGEYHTTESVKSIQGFGYAYAGLEYWRKSEEQMRSEAKTLINRLYSNSSTIPRSRFRRAEPSVRYFLEVELDVTQVERPCSVNLRVNGESAGSLIVMQQPRIGTIHGGFPLDKPIQNAAMHGMSMESTLDKIGSSIEVEIVKVDGNTIPIESVSSLRISLEDVDMIPPEREDELPKYGSPRRRPVASFSAIA